MCFRAAGAVGAGDAAIVAPFLGGFVAAGVAGGAVIAHGGLWCGLKVAHFCKEKIEHVQEDSYKTAKKIALKIAQWASLGFAAISATSELLLGGISGGFAGYTITAIAVLAGLTFSPPVTLAFVIAGIAIGIGLAGIGIYAQVDSIYPELLGKFAITKKKPSTIIPA